MWTDIREKAFTEIKEAISTTCLLSYPDWNKEFVIDLDASKIAVS